MDRRSGRRVVHHLALQALVRRTEQASDLRSKVVAAEYGVTAGQNALVWRGAGSASPCLGQSCESEDVHSVKEDQIAQEARRWS
jgi:hypothetical protein